MKLAKMEQKISLLLECVWPDEKENNWSKCEEQSPLFRKRENRVDNKERKSATQHHRFLDSKRVAANSRLLTAVT